MKICVRLTPGARDNSVKKTVDLLGNEIYLVRVKARPVEGQANKMLIEVIANFFSISKRQVSLIKGMKSRDKIIDIAI